MLYDLIIIGGSAAATSAGIYAARRNLNFKIITKEFGGEVATSGEISNWPGINKTDGVTLAGQFKEHLKYYGVKPEEGVEVEKVTVEPDGSFLIKSKVGDYSAKTVMITTGVHPRELGVPGEKEFIGRGISLCSAQDIDSCIDKKVLIVGGGNAALEAARDVAKVAQHVTIMHRRDSFRADEVTIEEVKKKTNITYELNAEVQEIVGKGHVEKVTILQKEKRKEIPTEIIFIEIGYVTATKFLSNVLELNKVGEIIIDERCKTSQEGIFACGDATTIPFKQTVISAGEGAKAALEAYLYLSGGKGIALDWA